MEEAGSGAAEKGSTRSASGGEEGGAVTLRDDDDEIGRGVGAQLEHLGRGEDGSVRGTERGVLRQYVARALEVDVIREDEELELGEGGRGAG